MKKMLKIVACMILVIASILAIPACEQKPETNDYITVNTTGASFSGSDVVFKNAEDFKLTYQGDNHYVAEGSASVMNQEQATTWGTVVDTKYIVVNVKMGKDSKSIIGWRNKETMNTAFTAEEIDGSLIKNSTCKDDAKNYILAISDGNTARHPELTIWRIEVTPKDATEAIVYTVDFSALY